MTDAPPVLPPEMIEAGAEVLRERVVEARLGEMRTLHRPWTGDWYQTNDAARDIYLAMFAVLVEAGYSLKPQKPTAKMIAAGKDVRFPTPQTVWAAMCQADEEE